MPPIRPEGRRSHAASRGDAATPPWQADATRSPVAKYPIMSTIVSWPPGFSNAGSPEALLARRRRLSGGLGGGGRPAGEADRVR
eukprot:6069809-Alexandrium_andersonii.AAC.1